MPLKRVLSALLAILVAVSGCAPRFHPFSSSQSDTGSFSVYRGAADGNAAVNSGAPLPRRLLFERKLNGGMSAQVIGNDKFAVVPTFNKRIYFLDTGSGKEITSLVVESSVGSAAALVDELLYFAEEAGGDRLVCFNIINGKLVWEFKLIDPQGAPVVYQEEIYIASRSGTLYCLNRWLGEILWEFDAAEQVLNAPAVADEQLFIGDDRGGLHCLDRSTGDLLWSFSTDQAFRTTPLLLADYVYCGCSDGNFYALKRENGELAWTLSTAGQILATPVAIQGRILVASNDRSLYCLSAQDGHIFWSFETDAILPASPIAVGEHFICATAAGSIYILDLEGRATKTFSVEGMVTAPLAYIAGKLWVPTLDRRLYCFGADSTGSFD